MPYESAERLSALDAMFLGIETPDVHMHTGSVGVFEAGPLRRKDGGLDTKKIDEAIYSAVSHQPRLRQRIEHVPLFGHPVWVDDDRFDLNFHIHYTCLPRAGTTRELKRLAGRILSRQLDRNKPLWEMWFIDGVPGDRFAQLTKAHHCMVDGAAGVDMLSAMLSPSADAPIKPARKWVAGKRPPDAQLLADELAHRAGFPLAAMSSGYDLLRNPQRTAATIRQTTESIGDFLRSAMPASRTPLNPSIGRYRRFDWIAADLDEVKVVKNHLGGTINDVVLACVAGALRTFMQSRGIAVENLDFRAAAPVNVRNNSQHSGGNHVSSLIIELPLSESDPRLRLEKVIEATQHAKSTHQEWAAEIVEDLCDRTLPGLLVQVGKAVPLLRPCNTIVTNVPGPQFPLFLLGARLLELYPYVPLLENTAIAIALFSYDGQLFWGIGGDWHEVPDLHDLTEAVQTEIATLHALALVHSPPQPKARRSKRAAAPAKAAARTKRPRAPQTATGGRRKSGQ